MSEINLVKIARNSLGFTQFVEVANYALENPEQYLKNEKENEKAKAILFLLMKEASNNV